MKKMATYFQAWKKKLHTDFIKKNLTPDFNDNRYVKLRPFWDDFVSFKTSEEGEARAQQNQQNAREKQYHHHMGSGGYKTTIPKWEKEEEDLKARGIQPEAEDWAERSKWWFFGHGGGRDPQTGRLTYTEGLTEAARKLVEAKALKRKGLDHHQGILER